MLRPIVVSFECESAATSSVLIELGRTKVYCAVSLQMGVPQFLKGKGQGGWLTAEYNVLPYATSTRILRDAQQKNGRSIEISRIIGRAFRTVVDLLKIGGEKTIYLDVDVIRADGGTRVASLLGLSFALIRAEQVWLSKGYIKEPIIKDHIIAVSLGLINDTIIIDPDFSDDVKLTADFNIIATKNAAALVEIQGGAEKSPVSFELFNLVQATGMDIIAQLGTLFDMILAAPAQKRFVYSSSASNSSKLVQEPCAFSKKTPNTIIHKKNNLFSLQSRINVETIISEK